MSQKTIPNAKAIPGPDFSGPPVDVAAFSPHPDDVEMWAGGTLARLAATGYRVAIIDLTAGEAATRGDRETRAAEAAAAARELGAVWRGTLDLGDSRLAAGESEKHRVAETIRRLRPRLVFATWFEATHPDHAAAARLVSEAAYLAGLASLPVSGGPHRPARVVHYELPHWVAPSFIVDTTDFEETKHRAILRHASQLHDPASSQPETPTARSGLLDAIRGSDRRNGGLISRPAGEAFRVREALQVDDPVEFLAGRPFTRLF